MTRSHRIVVIGENQSGKSHIAKELARLLDVKYYNSSDILIDGFCEREKINRNELVTNKNEYRDKLYNYGRELQFVDPACMIKPISNGGVVAGIRNKDEIAAAREQNLVDLVIWVDLSYRENQYPFFDGDMLVDSSDADIIILNGSTLDALNCKISRFAALIRTSE